MPVAKEGSDRSAKGQSAVKAAKAAPGLVAVIKADGKAEKSPKDNALAAGSISPKIGRKEVKPAEQNQGSDRKGAADKGGQGTGRKTEAVSGKPKPTGSALGGTALGGLPKAGPLPPIPPPEAPPEPVRTTAGPKVDYYSAELLSRQPLAAAAREALYRKCGKKDKDVCYTRNEQHRPSGVEDGKPSRHERVPPGKIVLMFNCARSSFELTHGDVATLPDSETIDLRALTSGAALGRIKISPEKGTPIEDRIDCPNEWRVGSEHGLVHDGLQSDGSLEVRIDWRDHDGDSHVALLRFNPWLAYGCGEGARLAMRKPGMLEGTAATVQRTLRDDSVVVRRDGVAVGEVTVDPTPFTVVKALNPRHAPGTRLLFVQDGASVDALVEPWHEKEIDIKEGSRHNLAVQSRLMSGWVTMTTKDGIDNLKRVEEGGEGDVPGEENVVYVLCSAKPLALRAGCDPLNSEKCGTLMPKTPCRVLEKRETEEFGVRAYISSLPGMVNSLCAALNEFNHAVQRFPSVSEYEAARANYLEDIVTREALVEDAITGNNLRIKDQTLHVSTGTDQQDNSRIPPEWNVSDVRDLVSLLLQASPNRHMGLHPALPVLVRAGPGTGKTWMAKQAVFTLADRLLRGAGANDGIRLVPIVVFVQRIIYLLREASASNQSKHQSLLGRYIESMYSGKKFQSWCDMLMQAYEMRALIVLLDGVDEAAGLREQIDEFVHKDIVPSGNRVLVTTRPEGILLSSYIKTFVVMNLCQLTNEQQRRVINIQMEGNEFFDHLLSLGEVRKGLDDAYKKIGAVTRGDLEALWGPSGWLKADSDEFDPAERQKDQTGTRVVAESHRAIRSTYLKELDDGMREARGASRVPLLDRIDTAMAKVSVGAQVKEFAQVLLADAGDTSGGTKPPFSVAVKLGSLLQGRREELQKLEATTEKKKKKEIQAKETIEAKAAEAMWKTMCQRTDEIYMVAEHMEPVFKKVVAKLVTEVGKDQYEADQLTKGIESPGFKDPVRLYEKAQEQFAGRFQDDIMPEACVPDVVRCRVSLVSGASIVQFVRRLISGVEMELAKPAVPMGDPAVAAADAEAKLAPNAVVEKVDTTIKLMQLVNKFHDLDPTHFRSAVCTLKVTHRNVSLYCEVEVHFAEILRFGTSEDARAYEHYNFFRKRLKGTVPEKELDVLLEEKLVFLVDATGIPVLLSLLVLIFTSGGEDLTKLPSNRIELYELGIKSAISKRLLPGRRTNTDQLVHEWLRLFNLDRSAMMQKDADPASGPGGAASSAANETVAVPTEKKEREHRPTRKASLSMEHNDSGLSEKKAAKDAAKDEKKDANQNKGDKRLFNLDSKEVYEVFKHGAHYLREANKPEVQRTELNRIELSMPKKLVDTVMMLVNANLKMLLGDRARSFGITMLRHVAVSNQQAGRREFSAVHVANALLIDQVNTEGLTLWLHLNKEDGGIPLTKTLEAQTELAPAQYQFKHLSFQEGLFAQHLLLLAQDGWEGWQSDEKAASFLNNPFMNNTCRIAAGHLGTLLAKRRPDWDFSAEGARLTEVGLMALWLICERNETLASLNVSANGVGGRNEDSVGLARTLATSPGLVNLNLSGNLLGDLKGYLRPFGRGLGANKTLTQLDVSNNNLMPDGIKIVCNALRTCTALTRLDVSYNSPGREPALPDLLRMHPTLRSVGIVEKEPTTRSERTWHLDTRAKEAIGRALLDSPATVCYLQCDVFALHEETTSLNWISQAPCDAIVLAGVLRANSTLKTLNIAANGSLGDFERDEIGRALLSNKKGAVGFCSIYGLKEGMSPTHTVDLKDKEQIRSLRSFTLFAGLLRANPTITSLTLSSVAPDHIDLLAQALATNTTLRELRLEQPQKGSDVALTVLPVQDLNGSAGKKEIDLSNAGSPTEGTTGPSPMHRHACGVVGALLAANQTVHYLKINPGPGAEGGGILEHLHRARRSTLRVLDLTGIGLGDRGGVRFFETLLAGSCSMLHTLCLGSNKLTSNSIGPLVVEVLRQENCNLTSLDINNNLIGGPVITQAIKFNKSLTELDITGNPLEDDGLWLIGGLLLEPDCTCQLRAIHTFAFDVTDTVHKHGTTGLLEAGAARLLFGVLKYTTSVTNLNLSSAGIEPTAAFDLANAVAANGTLKTLDLTSNPLTDPGTYLQPGEKKKTDKNEKEKKDERSDTKGLFALAEAIKVSPSLSELTLEGGKLPVTSLKGSNLKVKAIDLSRRNLSYLSAIFLGTLLEMNSTITELSLHTNELTPLGAKMVVERLQPSLKSLDLNNVVRVDSTEKNKKGAEKGKNLSYSTVTPRVAEKEVVSEQLEQLWAAVMKLGSLEKLTMDRDHLLDLRPDRDTISTLGQLINLKTLSLANNRLTSLPEDLCLAKGLKVLSLHNNKLTELPISIGQLESLEKLDLKSNNLTFLPTSISRLMSLKILDASDNKLASLDASICDLTNVEKLEFKDNPLQRPPATIARQGITAIRRYFVELAASGETPSNGARLVLLGHGEAGKTSLQRGLRARAPRPSAVDDRTIQLDIYSLVLGEMGTPRQVVLSMWDLAGQPQYAAGLQPYIVDGSLYLLTVPALDVHSLNASHSDYLGRWLNYLEVGAPNAIVLPVLTKCDMLPGADALPSHQRTHEKFTELAKAQLEWFKDGINRHLAQQDGNSRLQIEPVVQCLSSVEGGDISLETMRTRLEEIVFSEPPRLASIGQLIPRTWLLAITFLRALRDGRNAVEAAKMAESGNQSTPVPGQEVAPLVGHSYMRLADAVDRYLTQFVPFIKAASADEQVLKDALQLLVNQGEIFASSGIIYLQPDYVTRLLKPLVDHRMGKKFMQAVAAKLPVEMGDAERAATLTAADCLATSGELREELLPVMWEPVGLSRDDFGGVALMLCESGVLFLAEHSQQGRRWVMPMRLRDEQPTDAKQQWAEAIEAESAEVMGLAIRLGRFSPPGILERLMALCYGLGKYHKFWKRGAQIESHFEGYISQLLIELRAVYPVDDAGGVRVMVEDSLRPVVPASSPDKSSEDKKQQQKLDPVYELSIEFCGDKAQRARQYAVLTQVQGLAQTVLDDFEGLQTTTELNCPSCAKRVELLKMQIEQTKYRRRKSDDGELKPDLTITRWPLEDVFKKSLRCERCKETVTLNNVPTNVGKIQGMSLILPTKAPEFVVPEHRLVSDKLKLGKPLEASFGLAKLLGLSDATDFEPMRHATEMQLAEEVAANASALDPDEFGWTDLDWLYYLIGKPVVRPHDAEAVAAPTAMARPAPTEGTPFAEKLDKGHEATLLSHFAALPVVQAAGLTKGHVLALRLYSTSFARKLNTPLHYGCSVERAHPYPITLVLTLDALYRLRSAQADERKQAIAASAEADAKLAEALAELHKEAGQGDEEVAEQCAREAAKCAARLEYLNTSIYWRGVCGLPPAEFKQRGACEVGFLSLTTQRSIAQEATISMIANLEKARTSEILFEEQSRETARSHGSMRPRSDSRDSLGTPGRHPGTPGGRRESYEAAAKAAGMAEAPIVLLRVRIERAGKEPENVPTDISFLSAFPDDCEAVFVPGAYMEQKRESTEAMPGLGKDGAEGPGRIIEILPHLPADFGRAGGKLDGKPK